MCQILKMSYNNGNIVVDVSASQELTNCIFELYIFNFGKASYNETANIRQMISTHHAMQDSGVYRFKYELPSNCMVKCVISDENKILVSKERYIGERIRIHVNMEPTQIGYLYKISSDVTVSKNLIYYKSPVSNTKINIPNNILVGEPLVFTIRERNFRPKFESYPEFAECFNIEW